MKGEHVKLERDRKGGDRPARKWRVIQGEGRNTADDARAAYRKYVSEAIAIIDQCEAGLNTLGGNFWDRARKPPLYDYENRTVTIGFWGRYSPADVEMADVKQLPNIKQVLDEAAAAAWFKERNRGSSIPEPPFPDSPFLLITLTVPQNADGVGESKTPGYTGEGRADRQTAADLPPGTMPNAAHDLNALAADLDLPFEVARKALQQAKAELTTRENTARAKATPRPKWKTDRDPDENPAAFAWRAYQAEAKAGTLHRGIIYSEDRELHKRLNSWLRSHPMPEGIDIPTLPEWNDRQLAKQAGAVSSGRRSVRTPAARLYDAARYRAAKPA
jgi:hypothetical protein